MRRAIFAAISLVALTASAHAGGWGKGSPWNDRRAEVAVYDAEVRIKGAPRTFREHLLTMKEKSDDGTVFKMSDPQDFEGENFPIHRVTSAFVNEDEPLQAIRLTIASLDWTGNSVKSFNASDLSFGKDDYFEEQLPLSLRALPFSDGFEKKIRVWDVTSSTMALVTEANLKIAAPEPVRCRAGSIPCWIVTIKKPTGTDTYWFEKADPNVLVKMEKHDGSKRLLYGRARWSYWDKRIPRPNILN